MVFLAYFRTVRSGFAVMLINLCVALLLADTIFVIGSDLTDDKVGFNYFKPLRQSHITASRLVSLLPGEQQQLNTMICERT